MEEEIEHLRSYDIASLSKKCPAFENSCPFENLREDDFMKAVKKCPEFQDRCPFKDASNLAEIYEKLSQIPHPECPSKNLFEMFTAIHSVCESIAQSHGNCPVFTPCCPFKNVQNSGVKLVDLAESVLPREVIRNDLMKHTTSELKEKCPAFQHTCPYAKLSVEDFKNCPAFTDGCPFKKAENMADLYDLLSKIPHPSEKYITDAFKKIHTVSVNKKYVFGNCPVFHDENEKPSCPFKSVQSEGRYLVQPANDVMQA